MTGPTVYGRKSRWSLDFGHSGSIHFSDYTCASCRITYTIPDGSESTCPLCRLKKRQNDLEAITARLQAQVKLLKKTSEEMRSQLDGLHGMLESAQAASIEEIRDIGKMIAALFRVKVDGPARLSPMYRKGTESSVGFILWQYNAGESEYRCNTVGGVSLAMRYAEMLRSYGSDTAEKALARAIGSVLDNSVNIDDHISQPMKKMPWE